MPKSFSALNWKDPRVATRGVIGLLLAANLAAAVMALSPVIMPRWNPPRMRSVLPVPSCVSRSKPGAV